MSIEALAEASRYYGSNPDYVIAGGGNSSLKENGVLYVKSSGQALADAAPESFTRMDREALAKIWKKSYPEESAAREKAVLADLMAARKAGEENKRPSVETLLHDILPFDWVMHLHPALANGLACSQRGKAAMEEIFPEAVWIPSTNPGYILARKVKEALDEYKAARGRPAEIIFLQNHGVFVGAGSVEGVKETYRDLMGRLEKSVQRRPDFSGESRTAPGDYLSAVEEISGARAAFLRNNEIAALVKSRASFFPVSSAFTPDHIVYAGSAPLFTEAASLEEGRAAWKRHIGKTGRPPKIVAAEGLGVFGLGPSEKAAALALELFRDAAKIAAYSESFGGPLFMSREQIDFIDNWEAEQFRSKIAN